MPDPLDVLRNRQTQGAPGPLGFLHKAAIDILVFAGIVAALGGAGAWVFISLPGNPYAGIWKGWINTFLVNLLNNLPIALGLTVVAVVVGALVYQFSHHDHGIRFLKGAGVGGLVLLGVELVHITFPAFGHLS